MQNMFDLNLFDRRSRRSCRSTSPIRLDHHQRQFLRPRTDERRPHRGAGHILFSVVHPYSDNVTGADWIERAPISELDRRKIAHGNACSLFGLG